MFMFFRIKRGQMDAAFRYSESVNRAETEINITGMISQSFAFLLLLKYLRLTSLTMIFETICYLF